MPNRTSTPRKITPAQLRALEAIRDGKVFWYTPWDLRTSQPRWSVGKADGVRAQTVQRVVNDGLARVGRRLNPLDALVELTDAGLQALAAQGCSA